MAFEILRYGFGLRMGQRRLYFAISRRIFFGLLAGVSRSWVASEKKRKEREEQDRADFELILLAFQYRGYDKGVRGIHMRLLHQKPPVVMSISAGSWA
jgi:hypothetical protein